MKPLRNFDFLLVLWLFLLTILSFMDGVVLKHIMKELGT